MSRAVTAMNGRMTTAESLAEKLQMENDGKHSTCCIQPKYLY